jgi:hypothetical protein
MHLEPGLLDHPLGLALIPWNHFRLRGIIFSSAVKLTGSFHSSQARGGLSPEAMARHCDARLHRGV